MRPEKKSRRDILLLDDVFACNLTMSHSDNVKTEADRRQKSLPMREQKPESRICVSTLRANRINLSLFVVNSQEVLCSANFAHKYLFDINQMDIVQFPICQTANW